MKAGVAMTQQRDNSTFTQKVTLRRKALKLLAEWGIEQPIVCETHGGEGALFNACYAHLDEGVVFEMNAAKVDTLAKQRPTWRVYEADSAYALGAGIAGDMPIHLLDVDPYGSSWDVIEAFFSSRRIFADQMLLAVNDGLRQKLQMRGAWDVEVLQDMVQRYGNDLHPMYLEVCREMLTEKAAYAGYTVDRFSGYYCGRNALMTHFLAVLSQRQR